MDCATGIMRSAVGREAGLNSRIRATNICFEIYLIAQGDAILLSFQDLRPTQQPKERSLIGALLCDLET